MSAAPPPSRDSAPARKRARRRRSWLVQGMVRAVAHESVVCEVPTRFVISAYSNRVLVVVTQADNMGTLVSAAAKAAARPVAASADVCDSNARRSTRSATTLSMRAAAAIPREYSLVGVTMRSWRSTPAHW